jgi:hypothetical protein
MPFAQLSIRGVDCAIALEGGQPGITERWTEFGPETSVRFKCAWGERALLASALLGGVTINDDGTLDRVPPFNLPFAEQLYCVNIGDVEPLQPYLDPSGWVAYVEAILPANFAALTWQAGANDPSGRVDPSGLPYTTTKFRVSSEVFQPPSGAYYIGPFGSTARPAPEALVGIVRPKVEIAMTRHWMPKVPLNDAMELIGGVNQEEITLGDRTFPRGCLLFAGMSSDPRNDPKGFPVQDLEFSFIGNHSVEWNQFMSTDGSWQFLNTARDGSGDFPFAYVDFTPLFAPTLV